MNRKPIGYLAAVAATFVMQGCLEDASYRFETPPNAAPLAILFTDTSLGEGIGGAIEVTRAVDEASFSSYMIRWGTDGLPAGDASGTMLNGELNFIAKINKQRDEIIHYIPADTPIPEGVNSIVVSSHNALGESDFVAVDIDNL
ncbi:MAG: hypothetical protein MI867_02795, partial [Pseudomonadales bacterium]|nr:hypothetical protein [Pseudomonadales bacterium]